MMLRAALAVAGVLVSSLLVACGGDTGRPSSGTSGTSGTSETSGTDTSQDPTPSTSTSGAKKALIEACTVDADCESNVCYLGDQGSYCSLKCTADNASTVCIAPFVGTCNKKGFCRKP